MVLKAKNGNNSWSYFECEIVHSKYEIFKDLLVQKDAVIFFENESVKGDAKGKEIAVLSLETQKSHLRTILTDQPCYLLNDQGKTIERIN